MRPRTERTCQFCGNTYSRREHFERHVRTHTRERPFDCTHCGSRFARRDTWRRHMRACHSVENPSPPPSPPVVADETNGNTTPTIAGAANHTSRDNQAAATNDLLTVSGHAEPGLPEPSFLEPYLLEDSVFAASTGWQWDDALNLDSSFTLENLGTYDLSFANPSLPWLPLRPTEEPVALPTPESSKLPAISVSRNWFTRMNSHSELRADSPSFAMPTPATTLEGDFSREVLTSSLQQRVPDTALPSTQFLNRCIHMFTTRLWHLIPILHLPTFRPAETNPLLLLSICSLGALADGSPDALYHAERLYEGVHKAILVSATPSREVSGHTLAILQAAAIGQTFALLSGNPSYLMISQYYHSTVALSVRKLQHLVRQEASTAQPSDSCETAAQQWSQWIRTQSVVRLANAASVLNGEISSILHMPAPARANPLQMDIAAPDSLFLAKSHVEWAALNAQNSCVSSAATLSNSAIVEGFMAEISHCRASPFGEIGLHSTQALLGPFCKWFKDSIETLTTDSANKLSLLLLCHSCFINLFSDIDMMERVCGRDGSNITTDDTQSLRSWTLEINAKRTLHHSMCIYKLLQRFRVSEIPATHVARASWQAGLVLAVYAAFAPTCEPRSCQDPIESFPELKEVHRSNYYTGNEWTVITQEPSAERCKTIAYSLATTLRNFGPWKNALRYGSTLDEVLSHLDAQQIVPASPMYHEE